LIDISERYFFGYFSDNAPLIALCRFFSRVINSLLTYLLITFGCFATVPACDRQTDTQTDGRTQSISHVAFMIEGGLAVIIDPGQIAPLWVDCKMLDWRPEYGCLLY